MPFQGTRYRRPIPTTPNRFTPQPRGPSTLQESDLGPQLTMQDRFNSMPSMPDFLRSKGSYEGNLRPELVPELNGSDLIQSPGRYEGNLDPNNIVRSGPQYTPQAFSPGRITEEDLGSGIAPRPTAQEANRVGEQEVQKRNNNVIGSITQAIMPIVQSALQQDPQAPKPVETTIRPKSNPSKEVSIAPSPGGVESNHNEGDQGLGDSYLDTIKEVMQYAAMPFNVLGAAAAPITDAFIGERGMLDNLLVMPLQRMAWTPRAVTEMHAQEAEERARSLEAQNNFQVDVVRQITEAGLPNESKSTFASIFQHPAFGYAQNDNPSMVGGKVGDPSGRGIKARQSGAIESLASLQAQYGITKGMAKSFSQATDAEARLDFLKDALARVQSSNKSRLEGEKTIADTGESNARAGLYRAQSAAAQAGMNKATNAAQKLKSDQAAYPVTAMAILKGRHISEASDDELLQLLSAAINAGNDGDVAKIKQMIESRASADKQVGQIDLAILKEPTDEERLGEINLKLDGAYTNAATARMLSGMFGREVEEIPDWLFNDTGYRFKDDQYARKLKSEPTPAAEQAKNDLPRQD